MALNNYIFFYTIFAIINIIAFIFVGVDKKKSVNHSERIPEVHLFFIAIFFASLGVLCGMLFFRHKTRKIYFPLGIGLLFLEQLTIVILTLKYTN